MKGGGRYRCNYYRMSSVVVITFMVIFLYWTMFTSSSNGEKHNVDTFAQKSRSVLSNDFSRKKYESYKRGNRFNGGNSVGRDNFKIDSSANNFNKQDRPADLSQNEFRKKIPDTETFRRDYQDNGLKSTENKLGGSSKITDQVNERPNQDAGWKSTENKFGGTSKITDQVNERPNQVQIGDAPAFGDNRQANPNSPNFKNGAFQPSIGRNTDNKEYKSNLASGKESNNNGIQSPSQSINANNERWIVLTTIQLPTEDVKFLAQLEGWQVVVAGDTKTPVDWKYPNCHYISVDQQNELGFETMKHLPTKSYARKNAAYLYAISKGAKVIYETDDDNRPLDYLKHFIYEPVTNGLKYVGGKVFNPYRHFGQPTLWPRGYPLGFIANNVTEDKYKLGQFKTPSIQQGVVNGDPDMDAIFRLTRKRTTEMLNVSFDSNAPPAILPPGVLVPFNSQNTLFLYDALWALVLPTTVTFRVCDIWRGYWAQRLIWEIDGNLGFFGPNAFQKRNSHSYVEDAKQEEDLYFKTHEFFDFLLEWKCPDNLGLFDCGRKLTTDMKEKGYWGQGDVDMINAWFNDLKKMNYPEPKRKPFTMLNPGNAISQTRSSAENAVTPVTNLFFTAAEMFPPMYYSSKFIVSSYWNKVQQVSSFCMDSSFRISKNSFGQSTLPEIVLVVVFKQNNYDSIPYLNMLYSSKFPHIVYCGQDYFSYERLSKKFTEPFTFIEADVQNGYFSYRCLAKAMKMGYRGNGYMMITSDTLINPWAVEKLPQGKIWIDRSKYMSAISQSQQDLANWPAWKGQFGRSAYTRAAESLAQQTESNSLLSTHYLKIFKPNMMKNANVENGLFIGLSDVVYIPAKLSDYFVMYVDTFSKFNVFHEVVVPTIIHGLATNDNTVALEGKYIWRDEEKENYTQYFNSKQVFLSPVPIKEKIQTQRGRSFFCLKYLPNVIGNRLNQNRFQLTGN